MMHRIKLFVLLFFAVCLASCGGKPLLDETHGFDNQCWKRFTTETFSFDVADADECFDIFFTVVVDTAHYPETTVPIVVNIYGPDGENRMFRTDLNVRDADGAIQGVPCDGGQEIVKCVRPTFFFNKEGAYRLELSQCSHRVDLRGIASVKVEISRAQLDLPN